MTKKFFAILLFTLFVVPAAFVFAVTARQGDSVILAAGETINDSVFVTGKNVTLSSNVTGDVFVFGQNVNINGNVDGDIIGAAQFLTISGDVGGNIRAAAQMMEVKGKVERAVSLAGQNISFGVSSSVGRDALLAGETIDLNGVVGGSVNAASSVLNINGQVLKDVNFYSDASAKDTKDKTGLFLASGAVVSGNVNYHSFGDVKGVTENNVLGKIFKNPPEERPKPAPQSGILASLGFLATLLLTGLFIIWAGGKKTKDIEKIMSQKVWQSFGIGFAILICTPILGFILLITGFGAMIGFIIVIAWLLALLTGMTFSFIALGQYLGEKLKKDFAKNFLVKSLLGIVVGYILLIIPVIGCLVGFFSLCCGIGGVFQAFLSSRKEA